MGAPPLPACRRILLIQTAYLGDLVLTTPLVQEIARARPEAEITIVSTRLGADVFEGLPRVRASIAFDKRRAGMTGLVRLGRRLRGEGYDAAILAHRSQRSALLALIAGARTRVGFAQAPGSWSYTRRVRRDQSRHAVWRYLELSRPLGGSPETAEPRPRIGGLGRARERASALLEACGLGGGARFVALAPGSVWPTKRWTTEGYAAVARSLRQRGYEALLVGAAEDVSVCRSVAEQANGSPPSLAGRTSVAELAAVLERAYAVVGNDSGATHVAAAVGTPVVAVFGPTTPGLGFSPVGADHAIVEHGDLSCRPCGRHGGRRCPLGHFRCMREIDGRSVLHALEPILERRARTWLAS